MTSSATVLVDTSAAVPLVVVDHADHALVFEALRARRLGLSGQAAFETFSVLTRLPGSARRSPADIARLLAASFPDTRHLGSRASAALLRALAQHGFAGGSVYDAMVGAAAVEHGLTLVTRDRRAVDVYRQLGVTFELLG